MHNSESTKFKMTKYIHVYLHSFINLPIQDDVESWCTLRIGCTSSKMRDALNNRSCVPVPREHYVVCLHVCGIRYYMAEMTREIMKRVVCAWFGLSDVLRSGDGGVVVKWTYKSKI